MATEMKRFASALLLAGLATAALLPSASAALVDPCVGSLCEYVSVAHGCLEGNPHYIVECLGIRGSACISFHVGGFRLGIPHTTNLRIQFSTYGFEFIAFTHASTVGHLDPFTINYGFGVFTIDLSTGARSC